MRRDSLIGTKDSDVQRPVLVWQRAGGTPVEYTIWPERPITIGREPTNTISIDSAFVSKNHAILQYTGGQFVVEDLKSANGTRVNGAPISVYHALKPGDVIEVGDQQLVFVDRAAEAAGAAPGKSKQLRLAMVGAGALLVMLVLFMMLAPSSSTPGTEVRTGPAAAPAPVGPTKPVTIVDTELIAEVAARATQAGVREEEALHDEGVMHQQAGRYREAVQLFAAIVQRAPRNDIARARLAETQALLERSIADELAEARRAMAQLRFDDGALAWEKVLLLTYPGDPRNAEATTGVEEARRRSGR
ncbi:MAG: FHA domain-containing protein [Acidobacteria bacterium]|nr:FHA domain-containing protein [Acidobacteriota bacterium]